MPFSQVIKRTFLVYVSSILWMVIGILAFLDLNGTGIRFCSKLSGKHSQKSSLKLLCAFFSGFGALYLASVAPIASRDLTLSPPLFHILLMAAFIGAGGLITLVHFSLVFPKPKSFIASHPKVSTSSMPISSLPSASIFPASVPLARFSVFDGMDTGNGICLFPLVDSRERPLLNSRYVWVS